MSTLRQNWWFPIVLFVQSVAIAILVFSPATLAAPLAVNSCPPGMVLIPGGTFTIGSDDSGFVEERAAADVTLNPFCIDTYEITNSQFTEFVKATGYVTIAERSLSKEQFLPDLPDEQRSAEGGSAALSPGSLVFQMPQAKQVSWMDWWHWTPGANWQHPFGRDSTIAERENYPVVHIAYQDAAAYAQWVGKSLPTEAQWEYAARGGLVGATYSWGDRYFEKKANTWQGIFPFFNTQADGYVSTAPVGSFPPNGYGLYDMTGNVWEWTSDWFGVGHHRKAHRVNPTGVQQHESFDPKKPGETALHVIKGGSYLCAPNYCSRFRPAARESQAPDTGTTHIGFRLVKNLM